MPPDPFNGPVYFDANILIFLLVGEPAFAPAIAHLTSRINAGALQPFTSELTLAEILVRPIRSGDAHAAQRCRDILAPGSPYRTCAVTREILERAASIRAHRAMKLPDAIHAATALLTGCSIVLTNDLRFRGVEDLRFVSLADVGASPT